MSKNQKKKTRNLVFLEANLEVMTIGKSVSRKAPRDNNFLYIYEYL